MPVYSYTCPDCGDFDLFRNMEERNLAAACPVCRGAAQRYISVPNLALMNRNVRFAHATNERSRHEPRLSTGGTADPGHKCSSRCGHSHPQGASQSVRHKRYVKTKLGDLQAQKRGSRPWMLGH
jgi:putative FmdB family regulatory protein